MSYRYMRIMIFFDLPVETLKDRRNYRKFRKGLIDEGFIMLQESVYTKLVLNPTVANSVKCKIDKIRPDAGIVQMLTITEKQFTSMETIVGKVELNALDSTNRLVII